MVLFVFVPGSVGGHVDVIMKVLSWFGSQSVIRVDVIMNVLSWWCSFLAVVLSWFGSQICSREDVINYRIIADYSLVFRCGSWSCSLMVVFSHGGSQICSREDVIMIVLSWWFVRSFAAVQMSS